MPKGSLRFLVWLAEGLGTGRLPGAPGTWGSLLGVAIFAGLLATGHLVFYVLGAVVLVALSVPLCGKAEGLLGKHDPSSVVFDEIAAVPLCYLGWVIQESTGGSLPSWSAFFCGWPLGLVIFGFILFRVLDALKPPPVGMCQRLPSGWGVVADDVAAGLVTGVVLGVVRYAGVGALPTS